MNRQRVIEIICEYGTWHPKALEACEAFDSFVAMILAYSTYTPQEVRTAWCWFQAGFFCPERD